MSGIKMLLNMKSSVEINNIINNTIKNPQDDDDQDSNNYENYVEEITDEEYNKNVQEMDDLIRNIMRTKHKLKLRKLKTKIKTQQDLLDFMNIKDKDNHTLPPEACEGNKSYIDKLKINTNSKVNNEFNHIREKLLLQDQNLLKNKKLFNNVDKDKCLSTTSSTFLTDNRDKDDLNYIFDEIKKAESRCDDLLDDIDECIKLGEDLDKIIEETFK
jgi:hypothetical protein